MPQSATHHTSSADCVQLPTLDQIQKTLTRLDAHGERTAVALEEIAKQGAMVASHEKRLDAHDVRLDRQDMHIAAIYTRVGALEVKHAEEAGAEKVIEKKERFWTDVKVQLVTPCIAALGFVLWASDKMGWLVKLSALWKEYKG